MLHRFVSLFVLIGTLLLIALPTQASNTTNCVTVTTKNYYARKIHNDFIVREIEVCLSAGTKSVSYELPPLFKPLVLETTDGATLSVVVTEVGNPDEPVLSVSGQEVAIELPKKDYPVRYQMRVGVPNHSNGIILGSLDGQVVGQILLLDNHTTHRSMLTAVIGGLALEWWFETSARPSDSQVQFALITVPDEHGWFATSADGWLDLPDVADNSPLIIMDDKWLEGGYFAISATFVR